MNVLRRGEKIEWKGEILRVLKIEVCSSEKLSGIQVNTIAWGMVLDEESNVILDLSNGFWTKGINVKPINNEQ
jgi:small neutral amino acid transporter SnatA (MarC family)